MTELASSQRDMTASSSLCFLYDSGLHLTVPSISSLPGDFSTGGRGSADQTHFASEFEEACPDEMLRDRQHLMFPGNPKSCAAEGVTSSYLFFSFYKCSHFTRQSLLQSNPSRKAYNENEPYFHFQLRELLSLIVLQLTLKFLLCKNHCPMNKAGTGVTLRVFLRHLRCHRQCSWDVFGAEEPKSSRAVAGSGPTITAKRNLSRLRNPCFSAWRSYLSVWRVHERTYTSAGRQ